MTASFPKPVHDVAARGFETGAATYKSGRPDYPAAIVGWLRDELGLTPGKIVLDLGAGTGKFLSSLLNTGASLLAVEPVAAMRRELEAAYPGMEIRAGTADAIPAADESLDAVVCATAFHWFATGAALAEIRRVLKVGGKLGLIWNVRDQRVGWVAELTKILDPHTGGAPRFYTGQWRNVFPAEGFSPLRETRFPHVHKGPAEQVIIERSLSTSFIAALSPDEKSNVVKALRTLIDATPELRGDPVEYPYETVAYVCAKL